MSQGMDEPPIGGEIVEYCLVGYGGTDRCVHTPLTWVPASRHIELLARGLEGVTAKKERLLPVHRKGMKYPLYST